MRPKAKSKLQKRIDDPRSTYWMKRCDGAWGDLMHTVYGSCAVGENCSGPLEAHHLVPRNHHATRHELWNGILLCSLHHQWSMMLSAHMAPLAFAEWLMVKKPQQWEWVCKHKWDVGKPDYKATLAYLTKVKADYLSKHPEKK